MLEIFLVEIVIKNAKLLKLEALEYGWNVGFSLIRYIF